MNNRYRKPLSKDTLTDVFKQYQDIGNFAVLNFKGK